MIYAVYFLSLTFHTTVFVKWRKQKTLFCCIFLIKAFPFCLLFVIFMVFSTFCIFSYPLMFYVELIFIIDIFFLRFVAHLSLEIGFRVVHRYTDVVICISRNWFVVLHCMIREKVLINPNFALIIQFVFIFSHAFGIIMTSSAL